GHLSTSLLVTHQQPRARVDRIAIFPEFNIERWPFPGHFAPAGHPAWPFGAVGTVRKAHGADGFSGKYVLANRPVNSFHARQQYMVAFAHRYYQELPIAPEGPRKDDPSIEGRYDPGARPRRHDHPLGLAAKPVRIAESLDQNAGGGQLDEPFCLRKK